MSATAIQQSVLLNSLSSFGGRPVGGAEQLYLSTYSQENSSPVDNMLFLGHSSEFSSKRAEAPRESGSFSQAAIFRNEEKAKNFNISNQKSGSGSNRAESSYDISSKNDETYQPAVSQKRSLPCDRSSFLANFSDIIRHGESSEPPRSKFDVDAFMRQLVQKSGTEASNTMEKVSWQEELKRPSSVGSPGLYQKPTMDTYHKPAGKSQGGEARTAQDAESGAATESNENAPEEGDRLDEDDIQYNPHITTRLKSVIQSEFLSKEFFPNDKEESPVRTINEIMRDYGIRLSDGASGSNQSYSSSQFMAPMPNSFNVPNLNEGVKTTSLGIETLSKSRPSQSTTPTDLAGKTQFQFDSAQLFIDLTKIGVASTGVTSMRPMNISQNNETDTVLTQQDEMRCIGTSVDISSGGGSMLKYQGATKSSNFNIASEKNQQFSGDITFQSTTDFKQYDTYIPHNTTKYTGADYSKPKDFLRTDSAALGGEGAGAFTVTTRNSDYRSYSNIAAADALGFSLQAERQRLRNIDAMIATTPMQTRYSDIKPYKYATTSSFVASDYDSRRRYSTPALNTTTYPYKTEINSRMEWSTGAMPSSMGKSVSAPNYDYNRVATAMGSSVDAQYYPTSSTRGGKNFQYNNCSFVEKAMSDRKMISQEAQEASKKVGDYNFKSPLAMNSSTMGRGSPNRSAVMRPTSATGVKISGGKDAVPKRKQVGVASAPRSCDVGGRKKVNTNESRMMEDSYMTGFDYVKDLNRIWHQSMANLKNKAHQKIQKYQPYKPASADQAKNLEKSGGSSDHGNVGGKTPSVSWTANLEHDDMWGKPSMSHQHPKPPGTKPKSAVSTKSCTVAGGYNAASVGSYQRQPKSILKNISKKSSLTRSSTTLTPSKASFKSTTPTSFKNYPVTTAQMFAGLAIKKRGQLVNQSSSAKPKGAKTRTKGMLM